MDDVDFSTGSVGLGVAMTAFASLTQDYLAARGAVKPERMGRMISLLGDAELMNREFENYEVVTAAEIHEEAKLLLDEKNSNTIYYYAAN